MDQETTDNKPCACPFCDDELEAEPLPFCSTCGKEIRICVSCGGALSPAQNICPSCGAKQ
jgi:predicted amidophosphoribosyltransferase